MESLRSGTAPNVVIVDSPPLEAGVDALTLGMATGNLLLVLRMGSTDRDLTEAKLGVLSRLPVHVLGAVLNGVRSGALYRDYSYYTPGYEHEDEEATPVRALLSSAR